MHQKHSSCYGVAIELTPLDALFTKKIVNRLEPKLFVFYLYIIIFQYAYWLFAVILVRLFLILSDPFWEMINPTYHTTCVLYNTVIWNELIIFCRNEYQNRCWVGGQTYVNHFINFININYIVFLTKWANAYKLMMNVFFYCDCRKPWMIIHSLCTRQTIVHEMERNSRRDLLRLIVPGIIAMLAFQTTTWHCC